MVAASTTTKKKPTKAAMLKRLNSLTKKAVELEEKQQAVNRQPDYGGRFDAMISKGSPPNYTRQNGERPYSFMKVAQLAYGMIDASQAIEETQISDKLQTVYDGGLIGSAVHAKKGWLIPMYTPYLPTHTTAAENIATECRQKMAQASGSDPDQLMWLASKGALGTKALGTLLDASGGTFVQGPQIIELLEMQYKVEAFSQAGATQIPMMPNGRAFISKVQTGATAGYVGEGQTMSNSQLTTGQLLLVAKKVYVLTPINNELLRFGMPASEQMIRKDMAEQAALFADSEMFAGTGGTHIAGLLNSTAYPQTNPPWTQGVDKVLAYAGSPDAPAGLGTNGNSLLPQDLDRMANQLPDRITKDEMVLMMTRMQYGYISSVRANAVTAGDQGGTFVNQRILGISGRIEETVNGYRTVWSSNVPTNRTKGAASNLTCAIMGRFSDWVIARLGIGEIVSNSWSDTYWTNDQTGLRLIQQIDAGPRYLASFDIYDQLVNG